MAVYTLRSLVLRGVSVVRDGQYVGLRLGAESMAGRTTPERRINSLPPTNRMPAFDQAGARTSHAIDEGVDASANGAGRPLGVCVGRLRSILATSARLAVRFGRPTSEAASKRIAVKRLRRLSAKRWPARSASGGKASAA
jgi:hypothetical protein